MNWWSVKGYARLKLMYGKSNDEVIGGMAVYNGGGGGGVQRNQVKLYCSEPLT